MRLKPLNSWTMAELHGLIGEPETLTIEFKKELPSSNNPNRKEEFLKDATSLANASGGLLIYGIEEDQQGCAKTICGVSGNMDDTEQSFNNWLRMGVSPPILGSQFKRLPVADGKCVLLVSIPKGWNRPHATKQPDGLCRFFVRIGNSCHPMPVEQIRSLTIISDGANDRVTNFRNERIATILSNENAIFPSRNYGLLVLHVIPMAAFDPGIKYNIMALHGNSSSELRLIGFPHITESKINFDGLLSIYRDTQAGTPSKATTQLFRNGIVECISTADISEKRIYHEYEESSLTGIMSILGLLRDRLAVELPVVISLSFLNVNAFELITPSIQNGSPNRFGIEDKKLIDREHLLTRQILLEAWPDDISSLASMMKESFDAICNAAGRIRSENFDGPVWSPKRRSS